jgi:ribonuclease D
MKKEKRFPPMPYTHIQDERAAEPLRRELSEVRRFALDLEAAGFHRYSDRLCLIQLTTPSGTWILDPLAFDASEMLRLPIEDPEVEVVMHGSDYDLRLLDRDLGIRMAGLFDTQIVAALIGEPGLGLAALLEAHMGVRVSKKYQRADWAQRPLNEDMLDYAASDTRHLMPLADILRERLDASGRADWAEEEFHLLERTATFSDNGTDPEARDLVVRVKGARDLSARQVTALREALEWRDAIARARDRAPFRVVGDQALIDAVARGPGSVRDLADIKGFPTGLAQSDGAELMERLGRVAGLPDEELLPYPRPRKRGPGRPPPEVEALADRLKGVRNRRASELGLDRSVLPSNAVLLATAVEHPTELEALAAVPGMRRWQVEVMGEELLELIRRAI